MCAMMGLFIKWVYNSVDVDLKAKTILFVVLHCTTFHRAGWSLVVGVGDRSGAAVTFADRVGSAAASVSRWSLGVLCRGESCVRRQRKVCSFVATSTYVDLYLYNISDHIS